VAPHVTTQCPVKSYVSTFSRVSPLDFKSNTSFFNDKMWDIYATLVLNSSEVCSNPFTMLFRMICITVDTCASLFCAVWDDGWDGDGDDEGPRNRSSSDHIISVCVRVRNLCVAGLAGELIRVSYLSY
jgi:hypothetical protein